MGDDDLDIPVSWREVALHLRGISNGQLDISTRLTALENTVNGAGNTKMQDIFRNLVLPCISGAFLFLLTKLF